MFPSPRGHFDSPLGCYNVPDWSEPQDWQTEAGLWGAPLRNLKAGQNWKLCSFFLIIRHRTEGQVSDLNLLTSFEECGLIFSWGGSLPTSSRFLTKGIVDEPVSFVGKEVPRLLTPPCC